MLDRRIESYIENKIELIEADTWESWDEFYSNYSGPIFLTSGITKVFLDAGIDPLSKLTYVPEDYLRGQTSVKLIQLPNHIKVIKSAAFFGTSIEEIIIPEGCYQIHSSAFESCPLTKVVLPSTMKLVCEFAFSDCQNLKQIHYNGTVEQFRNIRFEQYWCDDTLKRIICTDGEILV